MLRVTAGDRVRVSIGGVGNGMWRIEIDNLSTGRRFVTTQAYSGPGRTADWVLEAPADRFGRVQPLGHYVPNVTFTDLRATGTRGLLHPLTMLQNGVVVSKVSRLMPHGFTVSYK